MSRTRILVIVLATLLLGSNALWAYTLVFPKASEIKAEYGCSPSEEREELERLVVSPLKTAIAAAAAPGATKQSVISAASGKGEPGYLFCIQDSDIIINKRVGLRFDRNGRLNGAS